MKDDNLLLALTSLFVKINKKHVCRAILTLRLSSQSSDGSDSLLQPAVVQTPPAAPAGGGGPAAPPQPMEELDMLGKTLLQRSLPPQSQQVKW